MRILLISAVLVLLVAGCGDSVRSDAREPVPSPAPTNAPTQPVPTKKSPVELPHETDSDDNRSPRPQPRPAPSAPKHGSIEWTTQDGHSVAMISEANHVEQLPKDVWGVKVEAIRWGCFGLSYRVDAKSFSGLAGYEQLKMLSLAGPVGDSEFTVLHEMPALETLELFAFYELNAERLEQVAKIKTLKKLILHVHETPAFKDALAAFKLARPEVVIEQ